MINRSFSFSHLQSAFHSRKVLCVALSILLALSFSPFAILTNTDKAWASDNCGTCWWRVQDGTLYIEPYDDSEGLLADWGDTPPWATAQYITRVEIKAGVKAQTCKNMFSYFRNLRSVEIEGFDTSQVTDMSGMFDNCIELSQIDLTKIDTSNAQNLSRMFSGCRSIDLPELPAFNAPKATDLSYMFCNTSLEKADLSIMNLSSAKDMTRMFQGCANLTTAKLDGLNSSSLRKLSGLFSGCANLIDIKIGACNTSSVTDIDQLFEDCSSIENIDLSQLDFGCVSSAISTFQDCTSLSFIELPRAVNLLNMAYMFSECDSLTFLNLSPLESKNVSDVRHLVSGCENLKSIDLSSLNMRNVASTEWMFTSCTSLDTVSVGADCDLSGKLPDPNPSYIKDATGLWADEAGHLYTSATIPPYKAAVYHARLLEASPQTSEVEISLPTHSGISSHYKCPICPKLHGPTIEIPYNIKTNGTVSTEDYTVFIDSSLAPHAATLKTTPAENNVGSLCEITMEEAGTNLYRLIAFKTNDPDRTPVAFAEFSTTAHEATGSIELKTIGSPSLEIGETRKLDDFVSTNNAGVYAIKAHPDFLSRYLTSVRATKPTICEAKQSTGDDGYSHWTLTGKQAGYCSIELETPNSGFSIDAEVYRGDSTEESPRLSLNCSEITLYGQESLVLAAFSDPYIPSDNLQWESSDPSVVCVDASGVISSKKRGNAVVTVSLDSDPSVCAQCSVSVVNPIIALGLSPESLSLKPSETHSVKVDLNHELAGEVDPYKLIWSSSNPSVVSITPSADGETCDVRGLSSGTSSIKVRAISYDRTIEAECQVIVQKEETSPDVPEKPISPVNPTPSTPSKPTITAPPSIPVTPKLSITGAEVITKSKVYNGKTQGPSSVVVKVAGTKLHEGVDYKVSYKKGKNVGGYKVTVTGIGSYQGTATGAFQIVPKGVSISKAKAAKRGFTVTWKRPSAKYLKQTTGYQVQFSTDKKFKKAVKTKLVKGAKKTSLKVAKLKGGKKYYVKVRAYKQVGKTKYYSGWSKAKAVKTKK